MPDPIVEPTDNEADFPEPSDTDPGEQPPFPDPDGQTSS